MEKVLNMSLRANIPAPVFQRSTHQQLGKTYLAALSVAVPGKGIPVWGYTPSNVTPKLWVMIVKNSAP